VLAIIIITLRTVTAPAKDRILSATTDDLILIAKITAHRKSSDL